MPNTYESLGSTLLSNLTAKNVSPNGLAMPNAIGHASWDATNDTIRYAVDMSQMSVDPAPPASLLHCLTVPLGDPYRAADIMQPDKWILTPEPFDSPSIWLLRDAHVMGGLITGRNANGQLGGQLILTNNTSLIPASYAVTDGERELSVDHLDKTPDGVYLRKLPKAKYRSGTYLFVGAANNHFGHTLLEGMTRLWALEFVDRQLAEDLQFIVYEDSHRQFTLDLLELAGVPTDRIVSASPHDIVEKLVVPDAAMRTHRSITLFQAKVWNDMAAKVESAVPFRRVYLSRRGAKDRRLKNEASIERSFAKNGYDIVVPEELSIRDQIRLARESISLAGCVGSQMYLACFQQTGARNIVMAPRNFFLKDDLLIARAKGIDLEVVLGSKIDFRRPKNEMEWTVDNGAVEVAIRTIT